MEGIWIPNSVSPFRRRKSVGGRRKGERERGLCHCQTEGWAGESIWIMPSILGLSAVVKGQCRVQCNGEYTQTDTQTTTTQYLIWSVVGRGEGVEGKMIHVEVL